MKSATQLSGSGLHVARTYGLTPQVDLFLERRLESLIFSFKTNKRLFKGILLLSRLPNYTPVSNFIDNRFPYEIAIEKIYKYRAESLEKMIEVLNEGKASNVLKTHPLGRYRRTRKKAS